MEGKAVEGGGVRGKAVERETSKGFWLENAQGQDSECGAILNFRRMPRLCGYSLLLPFMSVFLFRYLVLCNGN